MKKFLPLLILAVLASCKISIKHNDNHSDKTATRVLDAKDFTGIILAGSAEYFVSQDSVYSVRIEAPEGVIDNFSFSIDDGNLSITQEKGKEPDNVIVLGGDIFQSYKVFITMPSLESLSVIGSGEAKIEDFTLSHPIELSVAGSGDIDCHSLSATEINASVAGSGDIDIERAIGVEKTDINVAGSGDVDVNFQDCGTINVKIAGSGDVELKGSARELYQEIAGSGNIDNSKLRLNK